MILAIDFDNTIHDLQHPVAGRKMGPPIAGTREALINLKSRGHKIIVFTVWGDASGQKTISDFMKFYGLPFDSITNIKPNADIYLDDKGLKFTSWRKALEDINETA